MEYHSQFPYPSPQPQTQAAYYSYSPPPPPQLQPQLQPQQAVVIYPPPQNNVNVVQVPPYQTSSPIAPLPHQSSLQNKAPIGKPDHHLPMPSPQIKVVHTGSWTTGLFDSSLITALFPCVTFGQIVDVLDNWHTTCATSGIVYAFAPCLVSGPYRKKLRQWFGLIEAPASDRIIHSIFEPSALCQEYRELNNRGINPALEILALWEGMGLFAESRWNGKFKLLVKSNCKNATGWIHGAFKAPGVAQRVIRGI